MPAWARLLASSGAAGGGAAPARPTTFWQRLARDAALVGGSTAVCHALGVATSLALRTLLGPAEMGVWQGLKLFLGYSNYANLGASKGAARELAIARGKGRPDLAQRGLNLAFTVNTLSSLAVAAALLAGAAATAVFNRGPMAWAWTSGLAIMAAAVVAQRHVTFQVTLLRAEQRFGVASTIAVLEAAVALAAGGIATWLWGLPGLFLSTLVVLAGSWLVLRARAVRRLHWAWDRREIQRLIGIGGPILLAGLVGTLFRSIDKLMILACCTDREYQLGCYGLALLVSSQLYGLATMLAVTVGPRFGELYGSTGARTSSARLAVRCGEAIAALLALLGGMAIVAGPAVLGRMFPEYRAGLEPLAWVVVGAVLGGLALPASQYLAAVGRERVALAAVAAATLLAGALCGWTLAHGGGLHGVAAATAAANAVHLLLLAAAVWPELQTGDRTRCVVSHAWALLPTLGLASVVRWGAGTGEGIAAALVGACSVAAVWAMVVWIGWRWGGWARLWEGGAAP